MTGTVWCAAAVVLLAVDAGSGAEHHHGEGASQAGPIESGPVETGPIAPDPIDSGPGDSARPASSPPVGYQIVDGDIFVPLSFFIGEGRLAPDGAYTEALWPGGIVPYLFDPNVAANDPNCAGGSCAQLMLNGMAVWESVANVDFRPRLASDPNYLYVRDSTGNASHVGMIGGLQIIDIFRWNSPFTIVHELGHALGFWHEQSRTDRDLYVRINCEYAPGGCCPDGPCNINFRIEDAALDYGPYDFDSVMHYGQCFFSSCDLLQCPFPIVPECVTISVLPPNDFIPGTGTCDASLSLCDSGTLIGRPCSLDRDCQLWQNGIGQRDHLSELDRLTMSFLYPEADWIFVDQNAGGGPQRGTFLEPFRTFAAGVAATPPGGTLWVQPGSYSAVGTYGTPMVVRAPLGGVMLGE